MQFANVPQTAALPEVVFCSSKPLLHECVASTAPDAAYEKSTLLNETIPFASAAIESHFAAAHVGSEPPQVPLAVVPVCAHVRGLDDERE